MKGEGGGGGEKKRKRKRERWERKIYYRFSLSDFKRSY